MDTSCTIAFTNKKGNTSAILCEYEGFPDNIMDLLENNYNDIKKAKKLISNGDISFLKETLEENLEYVKDSKIDYQFHTLEEFLVYYPREDYLYLFSEKLERWFRVP